tara:strand:+ start:3977 stop:5824 length:1848 start_codon:yes stop_codon:yes gene_type:complete
MKCSYVVDDNFVSLKVVPPQYGDTSTNGKLISTKIVMVIDVSGSMGMSATVTNDDGDKVDHGWSLLDIVKHASNTASRILGEHDKLSIVTFSDDATVLLDWTSCADENKTEIERSIMSMRPTRTTNYAAGLSVGLKQIEKLQRTSEDVLESYHLYFFTDGQPTTSYNPGRGYIHLCNQLQAGLSKRVHMTTIGLGNNLDSKLLADISPFGFIYLPDPGSIGPNMCNLVAHTKTIASYQSTVFVDSIIRISPPSSLQSSVAYTIVNTTSDYVDISIGPLIYDVPRTFVFEVSDVTSITSIELLQQSTKGEFVQRFKPGDEKVSSRDVLRSKLVEQLNRIYLPINTSGIQSLVEQMDNTDTLFQTMTEEMLPGLVNHYFSWGKHFLIALPAMLRDQRRSNFRDKCLQEYNKAEDGTDSMFEKICTDAEAVFATTTPPTPSLIARTVPSSSTTVLPTVLPDEFLRGGGCWHENGKVFVMKNHTMVVTPTNMVKPNDLVYTYNGSYARVICIVKRNMKNVKLSQIQDLFITEWHPVYLKNKWMFPCDVATYNTVGDFALYDFVLEHSHVVMVDNVPCVTLGHNFDEPVVKHDFYGTNKVIDTLTSYPGWSVGFIEIDSS